MKPVFEEEPAVHTTMATVTACKYEFGAGQSLAFGIPLRRHFLISFNYWVNGELHTGAFSSARAIPQGNLFPITYDTADPRKNSHSGTSARQVNVWIALAILGLVIFFAVYFAFVRGRPAAGL